MKKQISKELSIYFKNNYPVNIKNTKTKKYEVILGIGGNIGNVMMNFNKLINMMKSNSRIKLIKTSPILKNPPFGFLEQNYFYNALIIIQTNLSPDEVLRLCWMYENIFKRKRSFKDAPRTLDIDIIFIKKQKKSIKLNTKNLIVPHKDWKNRQSVTIPLSYL